MLFLLLGMKYLLTVQRQPGAMLGAASAQRQPGRIMKSNCSFEKQQLFAILLSKRSLSECGIGENGCSHHFQWFCWAVAAGDSLFSSPTTHRPSHKTGGKNAIVLKIKPCCAATYCKTFFFYGGGGREAFCKGKTITVQLKTHQMWKNGCFSLINIKEWKNFGRTNQHRSI